MDYTFILITLITLWLFVRFDAYSMYILFCLIIVLHVLYIKPSVFEHLTDTEAIKNVANLYNTDNFQVTNLKVTGNLEVGGTAKTAGNIDVGGNVKASGSGTFGPAYVGQGENVDWAEFSHIDRTNPAHKMDEGFNILKKNKIIYFGGTSATFGPAYIGQGENADWAEFSHKDRTNGDHTLREGFNILKKNTDINFEGNVKVNGSGTFGPAYIGKSDNGVYAKFTHVKYANEAQAGAWRGIFGDNAGNVFAKGNVKSDNFNF